MKKLFKIESTKSKRFDIVHYNALYKPKTEWYKKEKSDWNNYLMVLRTKGYSEVENENGGDDDYLCVDHQNKQFIWCENGFYPFYISSLENFDRTAPNITLENLYSIRS